MYDIAKLPNSIDIGFTGEHNFRVVEIDMKKWMKDMPNGVPSIIHIRPGETINDAYIANTTFENNILRWVITQDDLGGIEGVGTMQVWLEETYNETLVKRGKSAFAATQVYGAINDPNELIPPASTLLMRLLADVITLPSGSDASVELEHDEYNNYTLHFKIPSGPKGDPGRQGDPAPSEEIAPAVEAWMDGNIHEDPTVIIDKSLSVNGAAADAKIVGQVVSNLDDRFARSADADAENVDLDVTDDDGNVLARFSDGHIKTKEFDSRDIADLNESVSDIEDDITTLQDDVEDIGDSIDGLEYITRLASCALDTEDESSDLDITDPNGNVIVRFYDGHIKTKMFDSKTGGGSTPDSVVLSLDSNDVTSDLNITDDSGNVIARFKDGHIMTKHFNSKYISLSEDIIVTVGGGGDFDTLNDAIEYLSTMYPMYKKGGIKCHVKIKSGTTIAEQIFVTQQDLQFITIIAEDSYVPVNGSAFTDTADSHDARGDYPFIAGENAAKLPTIGCLFRLVSGLSICGLLANRGSEAVILEGCGFEYFNDGVISNNESSVTIRGGISRHMTRWGVHARHNGEVSARSTDLTYCGIGAYADRVANLDAREATFDHCTQCLVACHASTICANASSATAQNCGDGSSALVLSENGSIIDAGSMNFTNSASDIFNVEYGGTIIGTSPTTTGIASGKSVYKRTPNTLTGHGIIYS